MSDDLIKRSDAIEVLACEMYAEAQSQGYEVDSIEDFMPEAKAWMNDAPSADRPQGEWINKHKWDNGFLERECSLCGAMKPILMHTAKINFCPNCGAKMKGADDDIDNV
jgi:NADH pyrophosphatase NudC (nudix superfamily)